MKLTRTKINKFAYTFLLVMGFSVVGRVLALPDLVVADLAVTSYTDNRISYSYTIENVGDVPAILEGPTGASNDNVSVQAYLSADQIFKNEGDIPAGGTVLSMSPVDDLNPGETFSGSFSCSQAVDPLTHPYLVLKVDWGGVVAESDETNNSLAAPLDASEADIDVSPLTLDFGQVDLDTTSSLTVTVSNQGSADLTVSGIALQTGSSGDFSIMATPTLPVSVEALGSVNIVVAYTPSAIGWSSGVLEITSDDPDEPLVEVSLDGSGVVVDEKETKDGKEIIVELEDKRVEKTKVSIKFAEVVKAGITKMAIKKPAQKKLLPEKHKLLTPLELYEIETTAEVKGEIMVSIDYSDKVMIGSEKKLKMFHKPKDGQWEDVTALVETVEKKVIGMATSFSDFGIFEVDAFGLINGLINEVLMLNLQQGIQNSLDAKLSAVLKAVDDFNAYNDIAAINTLEAFIAAVQAQSGNKIPTEDANALVETAKEIIVALSSD